MNPDTTQVLGVTIAWTLTVGDLVEPLGAIMLATLGFVYLDRRPRKRDAAYQVACNLADAAQREISELYLRLDPDLFVGRMNTHPDFAN